MRRPRGGRRLRDDAGRDARCTYRHGGGARQAGHPRQADGADARRVRLHHRGDGAERHARDRRPLPEPRLADSEDGGDRQQRQAWERRDDSHDVLQRLDLPPARQRGVDAAPGRQHRPPPGAHPGGHRTDDRRRHGALRARQNQHRRHEPPHRRQLHRIPRLRGRAHRHYHLRRLRPLQQRRADVRLYAPGHDDEPGSARQPPESASPPSPTPTPRRRTRTRLATEALSTAPSTTRSRRTGGTRSSASRSSRASTATCARRPRA